MASVMVEYAFERPMSEDELGKMAKQLDPCLDVRDGAWVRSSLSFDRKRLVCEFEAPDAETVRDALRSAGLEFERVWSASVFAVERYPELLRKVEELRRKAVAE
jgi:hypothetical protein